MEDPNQRITTENKMAAIGVHKMLQPFVGKIVERTLDYKDKEAEARILVSEIEDYSRHVPERKEFTDLLTELTDSGYELLSQKDLSWKVAGIVVLDCLLDLDDEIAAVGSGAPGNVNEQNRRINIANYLRKVFQNDEMGLEAGNVVLREAALFIGHLTRIATTVETEYLQSFYYPVAINMLTTENNDFLNLSGCLILKELAYNGPTMIYAKKKQIFLALTEAICSKHHIVRDAASESLETILLLVSQRESILDWFSSSLRLVDEGLASAKSETTIGGLLLLDILVGGVVVPLSELKGIMSSLNRAVHVIIFNVLALRTSNDGDVRRKVIYIVPQLANAFSTTFTVPNQYTNPLNFLHYTINYLVDLVRAKQRMKGDKERPLAYIALGKIGQIMSAALRPGNALSANPIVSNIVSVVREGLSRDQFFCIDALYCIGSIVNAIPSSRSLIDTELLESMFRGGLTNELVYNLRIIFKLIPNKRAYIQSQLLTHVKSILRSYDVTLDHGPRSGRSEASEGLSGLLAGTTPKKKRSSFVNNITGRGRNESNEPGRQDREGGHSNGLLAEGGDLDRFLSKSRFGVRATIRRGLGIGAAKNSKDKLDQYNNNYTVGSIDVNRVDGGSLFFNEDAADSGSYTDNQLILALQVLASPDFFSGGLTASTTAGNDGTTTTASATGIVTTGGGASSGKSTESKEGAVDTAGSVNSTSDKSGMTASSKQDGGVAVDNTMLLSVVRDAVMRYLDDYNSNIRKAAVDTCASVLDTVVGTLDVHSESYDVFLYILNHLLMLGVGDDLEDIRCAVFSALRSSLDRHISESENLHCVLRAVNDEAFTVRESSLALMSRIANYDVLHILPELRVRLHMLLSQIQNTTIVISDDIANQKGLTVSNTALANIAPDAVAVAQDSHAKMAAIRGPVGLSLALYNLRLQSVQLLQAMIRSARDTFSSFADRILDILIPLLTDSSPAVARCALGTIAELSLASPESTHGYLDELIPLLISSLQDEKNVESQENAVEALGKMVDCLSSYLQEPIYTRYPRLFEGLVGIIQNSRASYDLRLKAVKTSGLLGAVDADIYNEQMRLVKDKEKEKSASIEEVMVQEEELIANEAYAELEDGVDAEKDELEPVEPSERISNAEMIYFNVVIRKLTKIIRDSSLASHHLAASQVSVRILALVGPPAQKSIGGLVDALEYRLYQTERGNNLRSAMLSHMMTVVHVIGRGMRKHLPKIVKLINVFFFDHPRQSMDLLESIGLKLVLPDFNIALRGVLPMILKTLRDEPFDTFYNRTSDSPAPTPTPEVRLATTSNASRFGGAGGSATVTFSLATVNQHYAQPVLFKTGCILQTLNNLGEVLGDDEKRVIIPALVKVLDHPNAAMQADRKQVIITLLHLTNDSDLLEYANQLVLPLMRIINGSTATMQHSLPLLRTTLVALSTLACRLGAAFIPFIIPIRRNLNIMVATLEALDSSDGKGVPKGGGQDRHSHSSHGHMTMDSVSGLSPAIKENLPQLMEYEIIVSRLLSCRPTPMHPSEYNEVKVILDPRVRNRAASAREQEEKFPPASLYTLEQAWVLAGRNSASDLEEWMHRLSSELIRQSPSPIIRACASLSKGYPSLANELLTICVVCIWDKLFLAYSNDVVYENSLIQGIELALKSPHIKSDMVYLLLQLAEFMDMQDKRLPLDVHLLARSAESANMYAKALRYRELQFNSVNIEPSSECVESLITVNNQLGSDDRAMGVLEHVMENFPHISVEPLWLEKLRKWDSAKQSYMQSVAAQEESHPDEPPTRHQKWLGSEMGLLRCHHALGEFEALRISAIRLRDHVTTELNQAHASHHSSNHGQGSWLHQTDVVPELQRLGANACWNLGRWDDMADFLAIGDADLAGDSGVQSTLGPQDPRMDWAGVTTVVDVTHKTSFYRAVLAIHKEDYNGALQLIEGTRASLVPIISSLLSEGYTRAYRSMITMQILSELEEVVQYKQEAADIVANSNLADDGGATVDRVSSSGKMTSFASSPGSRARATGAKGKRPSILGADLYAPRSIQLETASPPQSGRYPPSPHSFSAGGLKTGASGDARERGTGAGGGPGTDANPPWMRSAAAERISTNKRELMGKWRRRLKFLPRDVDVYRQVLAVHALVAEPSEDMDTWLELVKLSRKEGMFGLCDNLLLRLGAPADVTLSGRDVVINRSTQSVPSLSSTLASHDKKSVSTESTDKGRKGGDTAGSMSAKSEGTFWEERATEMKVPLSGRGRDDGESQGQGAARRPSEYHWRDSSANGDEVGSPSVAPIKRLSTSLEEEEEEGEAEAEEESPVKSKKSSGSNNNTSLDASSEEKVEINAGGAGEISGADKRVLYAAYKVMWQAGQKTEALAKLERFVECFPSPSSQDSSAGDDNLEKIRHYASRSRGDKGATSHSTLGHASGVSSVVGLQTASASASAGGHSSRLDDVDFRVRCLLKRAEWMREAGDAPLSKVLECVMQARRVADDRYSVWHAWAVTNYAYVAVGEKESMRASEKEEQGGHPLSNKGSSSRLSDLSGALNNSPGAGDSAGVSLSDDEDEEGGIFVDSDDRALASSGMQESKTGSMRNSGSGNNSATSSLTSLGDQDRDRPSWMKKRGASGTKGTLRNMAPLSTMSSILARKYSHKLSTGNSGLTSLALNVKASTSGTFEGSVHSQGGSYHGGASVEQEQAEAEITTYITEAIKGFVRSIILGHGRAVAHVLQDTLRLLTLWFTYGTLRGVHSITSAEIEMVDPDTWLGVLPQLIARLHLPNPEIYTVLQKLLTKVGVHHPQALVCPISVARNTTNKQQKSIATHVLNEIRKQEGQLVEEATMVSRELMRVAISPYELWRAGLDLALAQYVNQDEGVSHSSGVMQMVRTLTHLHEAMEEHDSTVDITSAGAGHDISRGDSSSVSASRISASRTDTGDGFAEGSGNIGSVTLRDISFRHAYGRQLAEAKDLLARFAKSGLTVLLHQLWGIYQDIIRRMDKSLAHQKKMQLHHVSRELTASRDLRLCIPGTYKPGEDVVSISCFVNTLSLIISKQRPRRMGMLGSDGRTYEFLLKGKEDLRQDERVMQLFGLINVCLENDRSTNRQGLKIVQYSVLPLSNNSGVIGWLQNCDTFNALLSQYRTKRSVPTQLELKLLNVKLGARDHASAQKRYDLLPDVAKIEVFRSIQEQTTGEDLEKMLWLNSRTADVWVGRRDSFTRSLAVMSIVGYILGLGDRHMSNIMLDRVTGRVVHIDFGDCFEVLKIRSMYPETVPFRLTRMLTNAMGTSGMAGTYKYTSYRVMRVLREHRDSVMAMLEAFVYDPMVSWRVLANDDGGGGGGAAAGGAGGGQDGAAGGETGGGGGGGEVAVGGSAGPSTEGQSSEGTGTTIPAAMTLSASLANPSLANASTVRNTTHQMGWPAPAQTETQVFRNSLIQAMSTSNSSLLSGQPRLDSDGAPIMESSLSHTLRESVSRRESMATTQMSATGTLGAPALPIPTLTPSNVAVPTMPLKTSRSNQELIAASVSAEASRAASMSATLSGTLEHLPEQTESVNARALEVITRINSKLTGRDFNTNDDDEEELNHEQQVDRLIAEATSVENLSKMYWGWLPWY